MGLTQKKKADFLNALLYCQMSRKSKLNHELMGLAIDPPNSIILHRKDEFSENIGDDLSLIEQPQNRKIVTIYFFYNLGKTVALDIDSCLPRE